MSASSAPEPEGRRRFVGREREIRALEASFSAVCDGAGRVVTLAGPAGIGKSRLCDECADVFRLQGGQVLRSYCHEEPAAPPFWPWVRLLERHARSSADRAFDGLSAEDRGQIATIAPTLFGPEVSLPEAPSEEAARSRFRLFDALARFWLDMAREIPLVLVLEDLHWCDGPSLKFLEFLAHDLSTARLMLVLTYRDEEVERRHPLSDALGKLSRRTSLQRLVLGGLAYGETIRLVRAVAGQDLPPGRVAELHRRSEGNPFYLLELVRYLAAFTTYASPGSPTIPVEVLDAVPDGVRAVVGTRLNRLSSTCERLLVVAAVIGREFSTTLLSHLLETQSRDGLWEAIEEARVAHVIESVSDGPETHRFAHALIRETLYEDMLPERRMRLHLLCGERLLELHGDEDHSRLPQLAYHFCAAVPLCDVARAVALAERAARHASSRLAHEEAARLFRLALALLDDPAEIGFDRGRASLAERRCQLLLLLGDAQGRAGEVLDALQTLDAASEVAADHRSATLAARAAIAFEEMSWRPGLSGEKAVALLERARTLLGKASADAASLRARTLAALSRAHGFCGDDREADRLHDEAVVLARDCGDRHALIMALRTSVGDRWRPDRLDARLRDEREALSLAADAEDPLQQTVDLLGWYLFDLLESGDMPGIAAELERYERLVTELHEPFYHYVHDTFRAGLAFHRGRYGEFEQYIERAYGTGVRIQGHNVDGPYGLQMFSLRREQGRLAAFAPLVEHFVSAAPSAMTWRPGLALIYAEIGDADAARRVFEEMAGNDFADLPHDGIRICSLAFLAEVSAWLDDGARAKRLYELMEPYAGHNLVVGAAIVCYGSVERYLGSLAATTSNWQLAETHFERALESDLRTGARPWLAHTRERYAAMLLKRARPGDRSRARELLLTTIDDAADLGMSGLVDRSRTLLETITRSAAVDTRTRRVRASDALSRREVDVLHLLAEGASNRDIAERLFISRHTVANHVRNILTKTDAANRTEAVARARRAGMLEE